MYPASSDVTDECPEGTYCPASSVRPQACHPDKYCPVRASQPLICPAGYFCENGLKSECPPGVFCLAGTLSETITGLPPGEICPIGFYCPAGSGKPTSCPEGDTTETQGSIREEQCRPCDDAEFESGRCIIIDRGLSKGGLAAAIILPILFVIILILFCICWRKYKRLVKKILYDHFYRSDLHFR